MLEKTISLLNALAGALAGVLLAPVALLPGWLSISLVAAVTGVFMLLVFKYTSNQDGIKQVRSQIKAGLLGLSLFRDSTVVGLRLQGQILRSAGRLLIYSLVPMLVMIVPTVLLLGQLAVWYQARPLSSGEETVITVQLAEDESALLDKLTLAPSAAFRLDVGPVRAPARRMVCWAVTAADAGQHTLTFEADGKEFTKEFVVGDGFLPTSLRRPGQDWTDMLLHPWESPFAEDSEVRSIDVVYPSRSSWTSGSSTWLPYWFVASMLAAFAAKPFLGVNL